MTKKKLLPPVYYAIDDGSSLSKQEFEAWKKDFFKNLDRDAFELYTLWTSHPERCSTKVSSYFEAYSDILAKFRGKSCTLVEIGVMEGGSLLAWKKWLGEKARVIGIDANPDAVNYKDKDVEIIIGNQADPKFWKEFFDKNKDIDVIIDDGGHQYFQQVITFYSVLSEIKKKTLVIFEDISTSFLKDFLKCENENSFINFTKQLVESLSLRQIFSKRYMDKWEENINKDLVKRYRSIQNISFYCGLVSMQINPLSNNPPLFLYNSKRFTKEKDFRHDGDFVGVSFEWPDPVKQRNVTLKGSIIEKTGKIIVIK